MALQATTSTLWTSVFPAALRPITSAILLACPPPGIRRLRTGRARVFTASMLLAKNALKRLGMEYTDDIGLAKTLGASGCVWVVWGTLNGDVWGLMGSSRACWGCLGVAGGVWGLTLHPQTLSLELKPYTLNPEP